MKPSHLSYSTVTTTTKQIGHDWHRQVLLVPGVTGQECLNRCQAVSELPERSYLLSFCVMVPFSSLPAMEASTLLASLAKSRSLTSAGGTGTMAKASLSSFTEDVPICRQAESQNRQRLSN